ncbi:MAG: yunB [Anaerosporomusa subterranea]|jgi:sporulation protein YunB|nr:yunB [Anaerosporomusa subterranea]
MRFLTRRRRIFPKKTLFIICLLFIFIYSFWQIETNLKPTLLTLAETKARVIATQTINTVIMQKVSQTASPNQLVNVHLDNRGRVVLIQPNAMAFNKLATETTMEAQEALKLITEEHIYIPTGQIFGSQLFASHGPKIEVSILPVGTVEVKVIDKFEHAGINQTRHMVYLAATTSMRIVVPLVSKAIVVNTQVPIAEYIVVGDVPSTYLQLPFQFPEDGGGNGKTEIH